ncbi:MAG: DUF1905 domain-containing protein [Acidobacteria bacterium]|nr:DUF1905 domain-containing protein [Acidobacteriota bacterium]
MEWRGPAPHHFVVTPPAVSSELRLLAPSLTYGWGVIPAEVTVGITTIDTSLFPRGDAYMVPMKVSLRQAEQLDLGDRVTLTLRVGSPTSSRAGELDWPEVV